MYKCLSKNSYCNSKGQLNEIRPFLIIGTVINLSCAGGQSEWHGIPSLNSIDMKINEYT